MKRNQKGFTLAELLIVVAIVGVLVAVAVPVFVAQETKAKNTVTANNLRAAYTTAAVEVASKPSAASIAIEKTVKVVGTDVSEHKDNLPFTLNSATGLTAGDNTATFTFSVDTATGVINAVSCALAAGGGDTFTATNSGTSSVTGGKKDTLLSPNIVISGAADGGNISGGTAPYTFAVDNSVDGYQDRGLTVTADNTAHTLTISGTPNDSGELSIIVTVTDADGKTGTITIGGTIADE